MQLNDTLQLLALQLELNPDDLIRYAAEDVLGGYHIDETKRSWKMGSLWEVEGKTLYALIRALKPQTVVELGSWEGCSTTHIATALSINGSGRVTAVDLDAGAGGSFPPNLAKLRTVVTGDAIAWLAGQPDASIDFLFEDTSHSADMCAAIASLCQTKMAPGGVLVMHDAGHDFAFVGGGQIVNSPVGAEVRSGIERALGSRYRVYLAEPSDCGLAVMVPNPGRVMADIHSTPNAINNNALPNGVPSNEVLAQAIAQAKAGVPAAAEQNEAAQKVALEDMTKAELTAYAQKAEIDLSGARTKAEIIDRIKVRQPNSLKSTIEFH